MNTRSSVMSSCCPHPLRNPANRLCCQQDHADHILLLLLVACYNYDNYTNACTKNARNIAVSILSEQSDPADRVSLVFSLLDCK